MAGSLITEDYQIEFNGIVTGETNKIEVVSFDLFTAPDVRFNALDRPLDHGAFPTRSYYTGRSIDVQYEVWGTTAAELQLNLVKALRLTTLLPDEEAFVVQLPGFGQITADVKCRNRAVSEMNHEYSVGYFVKIAAQYYASNARWLSNTTDSTVVNLNTASAGLTYPLTYPLSYGASASGSVVIENEGSFETRPVITITGPVTNPALENITQGKNLEFTGSVLAGETLVVDFQNRTVLLNGTASRYFWVDDVTQWWSLDPGNNEFRFNGSSAATPTATVTWQDAWV